VSFASFSAPGRLPDVRREEVDPERRDARFGRLDRAAKLLALGAARALSGHTIEPARTGVVLASMTGCLAADASFDETRGRPEGASPALFPATLPTAPATELSIRLGLQGPIFSVRAGVRTALALAARAIESGQARFVLACGLEVGGALGESVSVFLVDAALAARVRVPIMNTLGSGRLLANAEAMKIAGELGLASRLDPS